MDTHQYINQSSGKWEYRTPLDIIAAARQAMGSIDLDVASAEPYNDMIDAAAIFTLPPFDVVGVIVNKIAGEMVPLPIRKFHHTGALARPWRAGTVWMNHPFGSSQQPCKHYCTKTECLNRGWHTASYIPGNEEWVHKLVSEYARGNFSQATTITFAATSERWARPLLRYPVCFLSPRTNYLDSDGKPVKGVTKGSMVTYLGPDVEAFARAFRALGEVKVSYFG